MNVRYLTLLILSASLIPTVATHAQGSNLTPVVLQRELSAKPQGEAANQLAERVRTWFGRTNLSAGPNPRSEGVTTVWAIERAGLSVPPIVVSEDRKFRLPLTRIGTTDVYAAAVNLADGTGMKWNYLIEDKPVGGGNFEAYRVHPDSRENPNVPKGKLTKMPPWKSKVFDGTSRDWWIYVPAQYSSEKPACTMVFQDGASYISFVPTVFDNLIAKGDMPVTVGIFINPGTRDNGRSNRSFEYDTLSDQYARFLLEEIIPEVEKTVKLRTDPASRAIAGASSGGICAWTVAWERPEQFSKVLSWIGSFTNIASGPTRREGGHNYPALIRKTPPKPIRIFLQDGANDLDNNNGNWPLSAQQMAKALEFSKYDYRFAYGQGFHSYSHGRAILPDSLRWLWRDVR